MNKRILISLSVIGAVAAIGIGGTIAYFSDTETSTGNTFTAGSLDLIIDLNGDWQNPWTRPFFTVTDMKPGDQVEKTISLRVDNNEAYVCWKMTPTSDLDNTCTEPEDIVDEPDVAGCGTGSGSGELDENLDLLLWVDEGQVQGWQCGNTPMCGQDLYEGDNKYQYWSQYTGTPGQEFIIYQGKVSNYPAEWQKNPYTIKPDQVWYSGIKVCAGTIRITGENEATTWTCDGSTLGNIIQSDSYSNNISFYAEQFRNNPNFVCPTN